MKTLLITLIGLGLASCAAPKAEIVAEAPKPKSAEETQPSEAVATNSTAPDDGLRIGDDILSLPSEEQLRSSPGPSGDGDATVIARPPAE